MIEKISISLTSIESRVNDGTIKFTLDSLFSQTFPIEKVYLVLPLTNFKGEKSLETLPEYLKDYLKLEIVRPQKDYGPVMKYIGAVSKIETDWVWICDDDIVYRKDKLEDDITEFNMKKYNQYDIYCQLTQTLFIKNYIMGVAGVLLNIETLKKIKRGIVSYPDNCCRKVDDQWVSMIAENLGYNIRGSKSSKKLSDIKHPNSDNILKTSLSKNTSRTKLVLECLYSQTDVVFSTFLIVCIIIVLFFINRYLFIFSIFLTFIITFLTIKIQRKRMIYVTS